MGFWRFSEGSTAAELVSWVVCLGRSSSRAWRLRENSLFKLAVRMYLMFGTKNHKLCCNDSVFRRQQNQSTELNSTLHSYYIQQDRIENGFKYFSLLSLSLSPRYYPTTLSLLAKSIKTKNAKKKERFLLLHLPFLPTPELFSTPHHALAKPH